MYNLHKKAVGDFKHDYYWSSEGFNNRVFNAISFLTGIYHQGVGVKTPNRNLITQSALF